MCGHAARHQSPLSPRFRRRRRGDAFRPGRRPAVTPRSTGATTAPILAEARRIAPGIDLLARFHGGLTAGAAAILAGELDVSFGRFAGLAPAVRVKLTHRPVRLEPMALLLHRSDPLAELETIPLARLEGRRVYANTGDARTLEWTDLAERLFGGRGVAVAPPRPPVMGIEEMAYLLQRQGDPVLTTVFGPDIPGAVTRPLTDPVPLSLVSMVYRPRQRHPGLDALHAAVARLSVERDWLSRPDGSWLPDEDAVLLGGA